MVAGHPEDLMGRRGVFAVTADLHLKPSHPERLEQLDYILNELREKGPRRLVIAGDLFDKGYHGYIETDKLLSKYPEIEIFIIPGNHDNKLEEGFFSTENTRVYSSPELLQLGKINCLFLPYVSGRIMGEIIEKFSERLTAYTWVLISHGDYGRLHYSSDAEENAYFPLFRVDVERYAPGKVLLGHIHNPGKIVSDANVIYPGSPFPLDRNEIGIRKYGILNEDLSFTEREINKGPVYWSESIIILPVEAERDFIKEKITELKKKIKKKSGSDIERIKLTLSCFGVTRIGREKVVHLIKSNLKEVSDLNIITDALSFSQGGSRDNIALHAAEIISRLNLPEDITVPSRETVMITAFEMIYGAH